MGRPDRQSKTPGLTKILRQALEPTNRDTEAPLQFVITCFSWKLLPRSLERIPCCKAVSWHGLEDCGPGTLAVRDLLRFKSSSRGRMNR